MKLLVVTVSTTGSLSNFGKIGFFFFTRAVNGRSPDGLQSQLGQMADGREAEMSQ